MIHDASSSDRYDYGSRSLELFESLDHRSLAAELISFLATKRPSESDAERAHFTGEYSTVLVLIGVKITVTEEARQQRRECLIFLCTVLGLGRNYATRWQEDA